ncbi:MAG TPA: TRAP transporter permease [Bacillota bacterium]|nr:TRAP transporter permease [Bacillota bacterium]HNY67342.1 TRAP transporter permease [Bacillota bacterium]HPU74880.1 TRAP transporter permease [Bacillota bacterium]
MGTNDDDRKRLPETEDAVDIDEILAKYDRESATRHLAGWLTWAVRIIALAFAIFQLYTAIRGERPPQIQRVTHLGFVLTLTYLLYPPTTKGRDKFSWFDLLLAIAGAGVAAYYLTNYQHLMTRAGDYTTMDMFVGAIAILLVLEAARRVVGLPIVVILCVCLLYAYFGKRMPGFLRHRGASFERLTTHMFFTTEGILGIPLGVSSTFIFLFIMFGAFLEKTGIGRFFIDLGNAVAGKQRGGPAKVAVFTSALEGTVSGSSVANTVGSGSFTIPMMKSLGYRPEFAGAVEAAASTGGQIMPPIMGAAAFLMAEFLNIPYVQIAKAAIIPAILYFTGIWIGVDLEAAKSGLRGLPKELVPSFWRVMRERGQLILPIIGMIFFLTTGRTPTKAALYGIILAVLAGVLKKEVVAADGEDRSDYTLFDRITGIIIAFSAGAFALREFLTIPLWHAMLIAAVPPVVYHGALRIAAGGDPTERGGQFARLADAAQLILPALGAVYMLAIGAGTQAMIVYAAGMFFLSRALTGEPQVSLKGLLGVLEQGARGAVGVAVACAGAGIIAGTVTLTGIGLKLATGLVDLSGGSVILTLFFTMITSIILGMGVPTTANYIITSTIAAPALAALAINGVPIAPIAAHMFVFYFGIVADITPPVALAAFAGAGIAKADPYKTGIDATKLAIAAFLVPYFFVYSPDLLLLNPSWAHTLRVALGSFVGMIAIGAGVAGWLRTHSPWWERIVFIAAGLLLIDPSVTTDIIGVALMAGAFITQTIRLKAGGTHPPKSPGAQMRRAA